MECNKDEALRVKEIAEKKFLAKDVAGAKKFALKAQQLFPALEGINQMIATLDVYIASEITLFGEKNWYAILNVIATADDETLKRQYRKLALLLHPDKNKSVGAEGAFMLISEAWNMLSDKSKREIYDKKRKSKVFQKRTFQSSKEKKAPTASNGFHNFANNAASKAQVQKKSSDATETAAHVTQPPKSPTFWTSCKRCKMYYEYLQVYLNKKLLCPTCHEPFLAEKTPMPNGQNSSGPWSASGQQPSNTFHNLANKTAYSYVGQKSYPSGTAPSVSRMGESSVNEGSYPGQNFQWGPFSRKAGTASTTTSSATVAQAANVVHQAYEKVKKEREEAQAEARKAQALHRKNSALKRNASESGMVNTGTSDSLGSKRRKDIDDNAGNDIGGLSAKELNTTQMERINRTYGDLNRFRMNGRQFNIGREFAKIDVRPMLVEMTKLSITKKLEEWSSSAPEPEKAKKGRRMDNDGTKIDEMVHGDIIDQKRPAELKTCPKKNISEKIAHAAQVSNSDNEINKQVSIDVPDSDFHDFDRDRTELSFETDQLWATYDEEDGMPRYYALLRKVISLNPFEVCISFLSSKSNNEFGPMNWVAAGFAKTCGDFRIGRFRTYDTVNMFSHRVRYEKGLHGVVKVFPRKGEVWALYRNWSVDWDENTPDEIIYKYDMVEVVNDYSEEQGISVVPLVKVEGFRTVFRRHQDPKEVMQIQKQEMFRFSHQVPSYTLTGEEAENAPKGCYELDPAATSMDLLQVITETKTDSAKEAID